MTIPPPATFPAEPSIPFLPLPITLPSLPTPPPPLAPTSKELPLVPLTLLLRVPLPATPTPEAAAIRVAYERVRPVEDAGEQAEKLTDASAAAVIDEEGNKGGLCGVAEPCLSGLPPGDELELGLEWESLLLVPETVAIEEPAVDLVVVLEAGLRESLRKIYGGKKRAKQNGKFTAHTE